MKKLLWALLPLAVLASCGKSNQRKLLIISNGNITSNGQNLKIDNPSDGAVEKIIDLNDPNQTSFTLDNNGTKSTIEIGSETGFYVLNLMKDTLFGSQLVDGRDYNNKEDLGLDKQKLMIDSLKLVLQGKNISEANKNFQIKTGQVIKITNDLEHARVFGPYKALDSNIDAPADGKPPVLFKIYSSEELQLRLQEVEESYNYTG
ncbi:MAG TPA: hypothetical protein VL053_18710 [Arachidicoccus sp.]|nr:hypothetical protein [Arachidicoccus sp.]